MTGGCVVTPTGCAAAHTGMAKRAIESPHRRLLVNRFMSTLLMMSVIRHQNRQIPPTPQVSSARFSDDAGCLPVVCEPMVDGVTH